MDVANCSIGDSPRYAQAVYHMGDAEREALRGYFSCTVCNALAWFRRPAANNRTACFAARHADGCIYKTEILGDPWGDGADGDAYECINRGQIIQIDLNNGADALGGIDPGPGQARQRVGGRAHRLPGDIPREGRTHRRLSSLLRLLVTVPEFRNSTQLVVLAGHDPVRVCDFFKPFQEQADGPGDFGGYWGQISFTRASGGGNAGPQLWLLMDGDNSINCHLDETLTPALLQRASVETREALRGMYLLVLKSPYAMRTGKYALKIRDTLHIAFRRA